MPEEATPFQKTEKLPECVSTADNTKAATAPDAGVTNAAAADASAAEQASHDETVLCPLCASRVPAQALTCPRCKSRLDAEPRYETPLAQAFTASGTFKKEAFIPGQSDPSDTAPMPALQLEGAPPSPFDTARESSRSTQGTMACAESSRASREHLATPASTQAPEGNAVSKTERLDTLGVPCAPEGTEAPKDSSAELPALDNSPSATAGSRFELLEPKRNGKKIALGVAAAFFLLAFVLGVGMLGAQANTLNQITDERVEADIRADEQFALGSASSDFVEELPYTIESVRVEQRNTVDGCIEARATVTMANGYFSESRKVLVLYEPATSGDAATDTAAATVANAAAADATPGDAGQGEAAPSNRGQSEADSGSAEPGNAVQTNLANDGWVVTCTTEEHTVKPTRGIYQDPDYGFTDAQTDFDAAAGVCRATVPREGPMNGMWFLSSSGYETVEYTFANDAWQRTGTDTSTVQTDYQNLVGTYADANGSSSRQAHFSYFAITYVDDATGAFEGSYRWVGPVGFFGDADTVAGTVSGVIGPDATVSASADKQPGSLAFDGTAQGDQTLDIDAIVYGEPHIFSLTGSASKSTLSASLVKQTGEILPDTYEEQSATGFARSEDKREGGRSGNAFENDIPESSVGGDEAPSGSTGSWFDSWFGYEAPSDEAPSDESSSGRESGEEPGYGTFGDYDSAGATSSNRR